MDIGKEKEPYVIEPLEVPVPGHRSEPPPDFEPSFDPEPETVPATPELVPA